MTRRGVSSRTLRAALGGLFLLALGLQTWAGWIVFKAHQQTHGEPGNVLGPSGYFWPWMGATAQVVAFAALAGFLALHLGRTLLAGERERGETLRRIEARLAALSRPAQPSGAPAPPAPASPPESPDGVAGPAGRAGPDAGSPSGASGASRASGAGGAPGSSSAPEA
jgi:hypothetical protein